MASGIKVTDEIKEIYRRITLRHPKEAKLIFAVIKFQRQKSKEHVELKVQFTSDDVPKDANGERSLPTFDQLIGSLPADDVRYILYDVDFVTKENTPKSQIILLSWHPQCSNVRARLICGSTFSALRQSLSISKFYVEADCVNEACGSALVDKFGFKEVVNPPCEAAKDVVDALYAHDISPTCYSHCQMAME